MSTSTAAIELMSTTAPSMHGSHCPSWTTSTCTTAHLEAAEDCRCPPAALAECDCWVGSIAERQARRLAEYFRSNPDQMNQLLQTSNAQFEALT